jgi:hypothetical protein
MERLRLGISQMCVLLFISERKKLPYVIVPVIYVLFSVKRYPQGGEH